MAKIIQWTNKNSKETGYVFGLDGVKRHFVNTYDEKDAMRYSSNSTANRAIRRMKSYGEGDNNDFQILTVKR